MVASSAVAVYLDGDLHVSSDVGKVASTESRVLTPHLFIVAVSRCYRMDARKSRCTVADRLVVHKELLCTRLLAHKV